MSFAAAARRPSSTPASSAQGLGASQAITPCRSTRAERHRQTEPDDRACRRALRVVRRELVRERAPLLRREHHRHAHRARAHLAPEPRVRRVALDGGHAAVGRVDHRPQVAAAAEQHRPALAHGDLGAARRQARVAHGAERADRVDHRAAAARLDHLARASEERLVVDPARGHDAELAALARRRHGHRELGEVRHRVEAAHLSHRAEAGDLARVGQERRGGARAAQGAEVRRGHEHRVGRDRVERSRRAIGRLSIPPDPHAGGDRDRADPGEDERSARACLHSRALSHPRPVRGQPQRARSWEPRYVL
jgi:hypothetical protein